MSAPAELVIEVTAEDIAKGRPIDAGCCAVALAITRLYPGAESAWVGNDLTRQIEVYWRDPSWGTCVPYEMPDEAVEFVLRFDGITPGDVSPFTFTARLVTS